MLDGMRELTLTIALVLASCSPSSEATFISPLLSVDGVPPGALEGSRSVFALAPLSQATPTDSAALAVLGTLASCALREGESTTDAFGHELFGDAGLAPNWVRRSLSRRERRWVVACLAARISLEGLDVPVSLRAPHSLLPTVPGERESWTLMEGGFAGEEPDAGEMSACSGVGHHPDRLCTLPDPVDPGRTLCGFRYAGPCEIACRLEQGVLRRCSFAEEVVTVYDLSP